MPGKVRVRFAPSPTGGLHIGGVRTVLYNYLFAKQQGGDFILRIEDTDQSRYVPGAEDYIFDCLRWCGLEPDESPRHNGSFGPYRQSERKEIYRQYAVRLVEEGHAYYAFDSPEELEKMRHELKTEQNPAPQYDHTVRLHMRNSLTLSREEVAARLAESAPHVIRIKMPENEKVSLVDLIRGEVNFETSLVDDKVLLKADGMPTYHLAVVVDDYLMKISHAFRGEEWLPSAPVHVLLWKYLFGLENMPKWAHFPLIMGPSGKLSKRDGARYGFPVFAMNWTDPKTGEKTEGFREKGFLPEAFINMLALLGWNDGGQQEIFSMEELILRFAMERVHSGGAKFDYEKAKWFNHEWIRKQDASQLLPAVREQLKGAGIAADDDEYLERIIDLVKDRCALLPDFIAQASFFYESPNNWDLEAVKPKWTKGKSEFFIAYCQGLESLKEWNPPGLENLFRELALEKNLKPGELQLPLRIMLVGGKFGPPVFMIAERLGRLETMQRINMGLEAFNQPG